MGPRPLPRSLQVPLKRSHRLDSVQTEARQTSLQPAYLQCYKTFFHCQHSKVECLSPVSFFRLGLNLSGKIRLYLQIYAILENLPGNVLRIQFF
jgi:hypothetical protein